MGSFNAGQDNESRCEGAASTEKRPYHLRTSIREKNRIFLEDLEQGPGYSIPEIDSATFVKHLLPPLRDGVDADAVVRSARRKRLLVRGRWKAFRRKPSVVDKTADEVFSPLMKIFDKITNIASAKVPGLEQVSVMKGVPEYANQCGTRCNRHFILRELPHTRKNSGMASRRYDDIALAVEFQKFNYDEGRESNIRKTMSNMQRLIAWDASRRFTFGITVEDTEMRLWFCSRSLVVVSKPFDFTKEVHLLTRVLLSFAFASKEELGWDPTMRLVIGNNGKRVYHIDVDGKTYETVEVLSEISANGLLGRATRVWKVRLLGTDDYYILKDVWVEDGRDVEHDIYEKILRDVEEKYGWEVRKEVASHMITPLAHWFVRIDGEEDHTTRVITHGYTPPSECWLKLSVRALRYYDDDDFGIPTSNGIDDQTSERVDLRDPLPHYGRLRNVINRRHYRIVFKEVAAPLYAVRRLSDVFHVLSDCTKVLKWIHGSGWVHRDISMGNLYLYDRRGMVGDFEYAKPRNFDAKRETRIGTSAFIAVEAADRYYCHRPMEDLEKLNAELESYLAGNGCKDLSETEADVVPPFFHNDIHDLESLWWIAIYVLFFYRATSEQTGRSEQTSERENKREDVANGLFLSDIRDDRRCFLQKKYNYETMLTWTDDSLYEIKVVLNCIRSLLVNKYRTFEAEFPALRLDIFDGSHDFLFKQFRKLKESARGFDLAPYRRSESSSEETSQTLKHSQRVELESCEGSNCATSSLSSEAKTPSPMTHDAANVTASSTRKRKRIDEDVTCMPPLRMARYELVT